MSKSTRALMILGFSVAAAGCDHSTSNGDGGAPGLDGLTTITVAPANLTLTVTDTAGAAQDYTASGTFKDGHSEDITGKVNWASSASLGQFTNGNHFASAAGRGGLTNIVATAGLISGSTALTLVLQASANDPNSMNLPSNPGGSFGGPATTTMANLPRIVYPADEVLVPPNLGKLEIHFQPGAGNKLFELSFTNAATNVTVYLRCAKPSNSGCIYQPDPKVWAWLAETNRGTDAVSISVRGTDDTTAAGPVYSAASKSRLQFSQDDIEGGLYYWKIATSGDTSIMRFDFASTTQTAAEKFVGTEFSGGTCIGCHALSHDGSKIVAEAGGQGDNGILLMDVATKKPIVPFNSTAKSFFESWNPDGTQFVGVDQGGADHNLRFYDGATGAFISNVANTGTDGNPSDHPDWSIDGHHIGYVKVGVKNTLQQFHKGAIEWVSNNGGAWSAPVELVAGEKGKNYYYPAIAPDNAFLVYNRSICSSGDDSGDDCNADTNPTARLFGIRLASGASPVELTRANTGGILDAGKVDLTNSFPKWSPFVFRRTAGEQSSRLMWVTFASKRKFGVRDLPASNRGGDGTLVWMAAVDPDQIQNGADPSYPAFVLPFQDYDSSNHIAQWTQKVVPVIQ